MKKTSKILTVIFCVLLIGGLTACKSNHGHTTPAEQGGKHECEHQCSACGKCTDSACDEYACENKCEGHVNLPEVGVDDLK